MEHSVKLNEDPFNDIKNGSKKIEIRLNDEKRQRVKIGDIIIFEKRPELIEKIKVKVIQIKKYKKYSDLVEDNKLSDFGNRFISKKQILSLGNTYYAKEDIEKYGFVVFKIKIV